MAEADLIIRGATVCLPDRMVEADVAVAGGKVVAVGGAVSAAMEIDGRGQFLLPGAIDAHVHYNEPGRTDWEGWATGSLASAAGGATCVFEMPLNAHPPTLDAESFRMKQASAEASSVVDFALWGGITPVNLDKLSELADCGAIGFKAFMSSSGMDDFQRADARTLHQGMKRAASFGLPVAVHAEDEAMVSAAARAAREAGRTTMRDYLHSRTIAAEVAAIREACASAGETGCRLHVVHVSCGEGLDEIRAARQRGVDVTAEACPHYLLFNEDDAVRIGADAKCAPPLRGETVRADLVARVCSGGVDTIGTDHSPCPPGMKNKPDFFEAWGGIAGAQTFLPALWAAGLAPAETARLTSGHVASRFRLDRCKGAIVEGLDADLVLVDARHPWILRAENLLTRHPVSAYIGREFPAFVTSVWVRGVPAWSCANGRGLARGRLVRPGG
ncbi:MAG: allantoinase AllB [Chthoniobacterales bacterium]